MTSPPSRRRRGHAGGQDVEQQALGRCRSRESDSTEQASWAGSTQGQGDEGQRATGCPRARPPGAGGDGVGGGRDSGPGPVPTSIAVRPAQPQQAGPGPVKDSPDRHEEHPGELAAGGQDAAQQECQDQVAGQADQEPQSSHEGHTQPPPTSASQKGEVGGRPCESERGGRTFLAEPVDDAPEPAGSRRPRRPAPVPGSSA